MNNLSSFQALTNQFYQWEQRGRGWHLSDDLVALEPLFEPFFGHYIESDIIDDGKRPSFWRSLFSVQEPPVPESKSPQPPVIAFLEDDAFIPRVIFSLTIPRNYKPAPERMEQLLIMLSYRKSAMSFEIIGSAESVTLQLTVPELDESYAHAQLSAFFPEVTVQATHDDKLEELLDREAAFYTVDFGLRDEFMRSIATPGGSDPYTALFGLMDQLRGEQHIAVQVLFSGVHNAWPESIMTAVCDDSGKASFFFDEPDMPHVAKEKIARPLFGVAVRMVTCGHSMENASQLLEHAATALVHASTSQWNALLPLPARAEDPEYDVAARFADMVLRQTHRTGMLLNSKELATVAHFPGVQSTKLHQGQQHTKAAPSWLRGHDYVLGANIHNGMVQEVGINAEQRLRHLHILGATGTGKSTLLHSLIMQDIVQGRGVMVLDPHGDLIDAVLKNIPGSRINDVVHIDPTDREYTIPFNILSAHSELEKELLASDLVALFKRFSTSWGDQLHSVFSNAVLAFLYNTQIGTLADLRKFLIEPAFRASVLTTVTDPDIAYYWQKEYPLLKTSSIGSIITRLDSFLRPKVIRAMVSQQASINLAECMDTGKIILVKLSQGLLGSENSFLLGAFLVSKLQQIAMSRQAQERASRIPFYCYIDEFHHFMTPSMTAILSGARKFGLGLIVAHQDLQQVQQADSEILSSLLANAGTRICFRLGDTDAKRLQEGFSMFSAEDLQNLTTGTAIARVSTRDSDFNLMVLPFMPSADTDHTADVIARSRATYSVPVQTAVTATPVIPQAQPEIAAAPKPPPPRVTLPPVEPTIAQTPQPRDTKEHRYLQTFIKKLAESHGYIAKLEVPTPDGTGQVDVLLEKDGQQIAVEISVTTPAAWEMHNVQKCLAAGYGRIVVCTDQPAKLKQLEARIASQLTPSECARVRVLTSAEFPSLFVSDKPQQTETLIKGYRVKVNYESTGSKADLLKSIVAATRKP